MVSDIPQYVKNTTRDEMFLQINSDVKDRESALIFATDENLIHLGNSKIVIGDNTFKYAPTGYK